MGITLCCVYIKHNLHNFYMQYILKIFHIYKSKSFLEKNDNKLHLVLGNVSNLAKFVSYYYLSLNILKMLFVLQLSVWLTTFGINLMLLFNNITPPSERSVHKELEYCFILLSSLTKFTCLDMTCSCRNKQLSIAVSSVSLFSYAIRLFS